MHDCIEIRLRRDRGKKIDIVIFFSCIDHFFSQFFFRWRRDATEDGGLKLLYDSFSSDVTLGQDASLASAPDAVANTIASSSSTIAVVHNDSLSLDETNKLLLSGLKFAKKHPFKIERCKQTSLGFVVITFLILYISMLCKQGRFR